MLDIIGNKIEVSDIIAYPGGGNVKAEYGLILYRVTHVEDDMIKAIRWESHDLYFAPKKGNHIAFGDRGVWCRESTLKTSCKLIKVVSDKNPIIHKVFDAILAGDMDMLNSTGLEPNDLLKWSHGKISDKVVTKLK